MAYCLEQNETTADGIRRIALEQINKAIQEVESQKIDHHKKVHQIRKRCKKLRGLVRLVRPCLAENYQRENAWYRESARALSDIRDAQALIVCSEELLQQFSTTFPPGTFAELHQRLILYRDRSAATTSDIDKRLDNFRQRMLQGRTRIADWPLDQGGFDLLEGGLKKTYGRGRKAMAAAYQTETVEDFHEWRKRVKYHWYHARLLRNIWPQLMNAYNAEMKRLSDLLGDDHDLAVLQQTLLDSPESFGSDEMVQAFIGLARQRQMNLRQLARPLGNRIYLEKPAKHGKRFGCYWKVWLNDT